MIENDKPNAAALRWQVRNTECPYRNKTLSLRVDNIEVPDGKERSTLTSNAPKR